jgi:hypothetical protein
MFKHSRAVLPERAFRARLAHVAPGLAGRPRSATTETPAPTARASSRTTGGTSGGTPRHKDGEI